MKLDCLHMGRLLERRNSGLSAAEGLRLEEHLASCATCRADASLLTGLSELAAATRVELGGAVRERAIANALAVGARPHSARAARPRRPGVLLLSAAVAAAAVIGFVSVQQLSREPGANARVLSGEVQFSLPTSAESHGTPESVHAQAEPRPRGAVGESARARRASSTRAHDEGAVDASALLAQARQQLAARELTKARATLESVRPHLRDAAQRAQALSLAAECELQARDFSAARDTYLQVVRTFPGIPAAETALFAAARIEAEHGDPAHATELLQRYLATYPQGSYQREAQRRLQRLTGQSSP